MEFNPANHVIQLCIQGMELEEKGKPEAPLRIVGEVTDWVRQTPEQVEAWRQKLANSKKEIIN